MLGDFQTDLIRGVVKGLKIETTLAPPIILNDPFEPSSGGASVLLRALKPRLTIITPNDPIVIAPFGPPEPNQFGKLVFGGAVVGGLALVGLASGLHWIFKRRSK